VAKAKLEKPADVPEGIVLYTDGSVRPVNPGYGGWGVHGYSYMAQNSKKGNGNATQLLTADGYVEKITVKESKPVEIKALSYIDGFGSYDIPITNNHAEIAGVANAFAYADKYDIKKLTVMTDSDYTVKGTTQWLPIWHKNNWFKQDGNPVANKEVWLGLEERLNKLKAKGVEVEVKWIKGHSTHLGNQIADKNANIGSAYSKTHLARAEINTVSPEGYWNPKAERHPFICQKRIYFSTKKDVNIPGEYYLGDHGKDDELLGSRQVDGCYSYIELKTPDPLIEILRKKQCMESNDLDRIIMGRLDKLFQGPAATDLLRFGDICLLKPHTHKLDLHFFDKEPMTKELKPPRLAMRALEALNTLKGIFQAWQNKQEDIITETNITQLFFTRDDDNKDYKLKEQFVPGYTSVVSSILYGKEGKAAKIDLCLGVDLPDRNALKKLEKLKPEVFVVSWMEADKAFRYATIIKERDNFGIWAGMYSNLRFIT
jgi:ribonuclease HI